MIDLNKKFNNPNKFGHLYRQGQELDLSKIDQCNPKKIYWEGIVVDLLPQRWHRDGNKIKVKRDIISPTSPPTSRKYTFVLDVTENKFYNAVKVKNGTGSGYGQK